MQEVLDGCKQHARAIFVYSPGPPRQCNTLALAHGVEPEAVVEAHHLVALLLHNRPRPLPKVLPAEQRPVMVHKYSWYQGSCRTNKR